MSVATHRVTTENAPFADRNKNFLPFLKTFEIASFIMQNPSPVSAIFNAIDRATGLHAVLEEFHIQAVSPGRESIGEASVLISMNGKKFSGRGASTNILEACAKAYLNALNKNELSGENS